MITQPSDYEEMLWQIQSNTPREIAILLPKDEQIYDIDLNTRIVNVPKFLSVAKDHQAETIYFKLDRYFGLKDLSQTTCIIEYTNALGNTYVYPVPFYDVKTFGYENKMLIPWCIQGHATEAAGTVRFAVIFFNVDARHKLSYCLNTLVARGEILSGQNNSVDGISESQITLDATLLELLQEIERLSNDQILSVFWLDV